VLGIEILAWAFCLFFGLFVSAHVVMCLLSKWAEIVEWIADAWLSA